jgi:hypothetical protein
MLSRRQLLRCVGGAGALALLAPSVFADASNLPPLVETLLAEFVAESLPDGGGIDRAKSRWQKPGRGAATGSEMFPGGIDPRYFKIGAEALFRFTKSTGRDEYRRVANDYVTYMARSVAARHPTWAIGNVLELLGVRHTFNRGVNNDADVEAAKRLVEFARSRAVKVTTLDGVTFRYFPFGYGIAEYKAKDAGWTNDLSMFGSGLVHAYELTNDASFLDDAVSFAEYFVQPWRRDALGKDGYWQCGTWHEKLGSWVIGSSHYSGFESTDLHADEASWVFSTNTCIDFLTRLHRHRPDERFVDRCVRAAEWTFRDCQFDDGAVGMCGRDDKWLGMTGAAVTQVASVTPMLKATDERLIKLRECAQRATRYLAARLHIAKVEDHGVDWVNHKTTTDPLVNVAMLWAMMLVGWLDAPRAGASV